MTPDVIGLGRDRDRPSVELNLIANFLSLGFVIISGVIAVPFYVQMLGAEAFGVIGFYSLLNAGFQVFDFGLSATLARECARYRAGALEPDVLRRLFNAFEIIFLAFAGVGALSVALGSHLIANSWLRLEKLGSDEVAAAIALLAIAAALQWICGLYRGAFTGFEKQVRLGAINVIFATARSFGVIGVLLALGPSLTTFFGYQVLLGLVELLTLRATSVRFMPKLAPGRRTKLAPWGDIQKVFSFSASIAFVTLCWAAQTQGDRLILSKTLSLSDYGIFTLAVTASAALTTLSAPMGQALLPRLTRLRAEAEEKASIQLYRNATQLACILAVPACLVLAVFARPALWVWTGDHAVANQAAPVLSAYAIGAGLVPISAFPYYLQYSHGALRLHIVGQGLLVTVLIPAMVISAHYRGATGVGMAWTSLMAVYFLLWTPIVHRKLAPGLHWPWLLRDILPTVSAAATVVGLEALLLRWSNERGLAFIQLVCASGAALVAGALSSSSMRQWLFEKRQLLGWRAT